MKARLTAMALLAPTHALGSVCANYRPGWVAVQGAVTPLQEVGYFLFSPVGVGIVALVAWHLIRPSYLARFVALILLAFAMFGQLEGIMGGPSVPAVAYSEGCRGAPWVTLPILLILAGLVLWRKPARRLTSTDS